MEKFIKFVLKRLVETRVDLCGENSRFVEFVDELHEDYDWSRGFNSKALFGRITFERKDGTLGCSAPVVLKLSPSNRTIAEYSLGFFNEVRFYTRILPLFELARPVKHLFPTYYDSVMRLSRTSHDELAIVFENLQADRYVCAKKMAFLDYDHLALMLRKLGEFHSYSYHAKATNRFQALTSALTETNPVVLQYFHPVILKSVAFRAMTPLLNDRVYSSKVAAFAQLLNNTDDVYRDILLQDKDASKTTSVLCHGDFWANNVLFKYDDAGRPRDAKFVDLASCRIASPVFDLITVLYLNADQNLRKARWDDLMDAYHQSLRSTFRSTKVPSLETILGEFKGRAALGFFIATMLLPAMIASDNGLPDPFTLLRNEHSTTSYEARTNVLCKVGGDLATNALCEILKDMIDRDFW